MNFRRFSYLEGKHAILGASNYHWLSKDEAALIAYYRNMKAKERGTRLHNLARGMIADGIEASSAHNTFNDYVNDAIKYRMTPEVVLRYSDNAFGTTDAIMFDKNVLRIHDLKTGITPASMDQLMVYNALFCLQYGFDPKDLDTELRIYQNNDVSVYNPSSDEVEEVMEKMVRADRLISDLENQEEP